MQFWSQTDGHITLPSGRVLDLRRARSEGPLDREELEFCRIHGVPLAYDPAQIGWVPISCEDDLTIILQAAEQVPLGRRGVRSGHVRFRPWGRHEVGTFVSLLDNPKVWEHLPDPFPNPLTAEDASALIELSLEAEHHDVRAVEIDGEVVGQVRLAFDPIRSDRTVGEISYWLGERHWGRGIGSDLVSRFTSHSFDRRPELSGIWARVHENNTRSARILEKAGYRYGGPIADNSPWRTYRIDRVSIE